MIQIQPRKRRDDIKAIRTKRSIIELALGEYFSELAGSFEKCKVIDGEEKTLYKIPRSSIVMIHKRGA